LQLAHYYEHLSSLGLAAPDYLVGIVGRDFQSISWAYLDLTIQGRGSNAPTYLSIYYDNFLQAQDVVHKAKERNKDESIQPITIPRRKNGKFGCQMCTFKTICQDEMKNFDNGAGHVTLLAGVTTAFAEKNFPGIESIRELLDAPNLSETGEKARRRARAWITGVPELVDPSEPLEIPSFDIEVDIDLENSQALLEEFLEGETLGDDRVYLYGYGVHDRTINPDWKSAEFGHFANFDNTDEAEYEVLLNMWRKLEELVASAQSQNKTIGVFHYSPHEKTWWRKFAKKYAERADTPRIEHINVFMDQNFVDLLEYSRKLALKSSSYSIKHLAPLANFYWSVDNPGGAISLIKYKLATGGTSSDLAKQEAIKWLIDYNRDDVRATFAVREDLRRLPL
jgi:predicted RecB family nuclease